MTAPSATWSGSRTRYSPPASPLATRAAVTACAVDATPFEGWAVTRDYSRVPDPLLEHRRAVLEDPDLPEPDLTRLARQGNGGIGTYGPDGHLQRTRDPDVRTGWRTATAKRTAGTYSGYEVTLAVACASAHWSGNPDKIALGKPIPPYILALDVTPGGTNPGPVGYRTVERSRLVAPGIVEVIADRGYTVKRVDFVRRLHRANIDVVMDYTQRVRQRPTAMTFRGGQETILEHCGTLLHHWMPPSLQAPPENLSGQRLAAWYSSRARLYRWSPHHHFEGGKKQFRCPVCAGRANSPTSATHSPTVPLIAAPPGATACCGGLLTVDIEHLDRYQAVPLRHTRIACQLRPAQSGRKRQQNGQGQRRPLRWIVQSLPHPAHTLATAMLAVIHNITQTARSHKTPTNATAPSRPRPTVPTPAHAPRNDTPGRSEPRSPLTAHPTPHRSRTAQHRRLRRAREPDQSATPPPRALATAHNRPITPPERPKRPKNRPNRHVNVLELTWCR